MLSPEPFRIDSRHWLLALLAALIVHSAIFLSYQSNKTVGAEETSQKSIVIRLKKITFPPKIAPPPVMQPKVEPLPKPEPRLKPLVKPKPSPKIEPKPNSIVKPVKIYEARVDPILYDNIKRDDDNNKLEDSERIDLSLKHSYESQLLAWLQRHKKYPNLARRRGQQGIVILEFVINAEGKLLSHKIIQASAHTALNTAVVKMIKQASPMPPVPQELHRKRDQFSYTIPIHFTLSK
jgi:protein TonB